jgi:hypothetical protein
MLMAKDHTEVLVSKLPMCDICSHDVQMNKAGSQRLEAHYDGRTSFGPWAYMCETHFARLGVGLGLGNGQKLVLKLSHPVPNDPDDSIKAEVADIMGLTLDEVDW